MEKKVFDKFKFIEKATTIFAWFVFAIAVFFSTATIFTSFSDDKNGKEIFGVKFLIVTSDSMKKSELSEEEKIHFNTGDIVVIKVDVDTSALKEGDVITFVSRSPESYGKTVTHKIRNIKYSASGFPTEYVTYGINKNVNDLVAVKPEDVVGTYAQKIPKLGGVIAFFKGTTGLFLTIVTPAILLIMYFCIKIGRTFGRKSAIDECYSQIESLKSKITTLENEKSKKKEQVIFFKA